MDDAAITVIFNSHPDCLVMIGVFLTLENIMTWFIKGTLGGGFGGTEYSEWIESDAVNYDQAMKDAEELAFDEYESYSGSNGLFNEEDFLEDEPDATEEDIDDAYNEDRDSWCEYEAVESKKTLEEMNA